MLILSRPETIGNWIRRMSPESCRIFRKKVAIIVIFATENMAEANPHQSDSFLKYVAIYTELMPSMLVYTGLLFFKAGMIYFSRTWTDLKEPGEPATA